MTISERPRGLPSGNRGKQSGDRRQRPPIAPIAPINRGNPKYRTSRHNALTCNWGNWGNQLPPHARVRVCCTKVCTTEMAGSS